eukprot:6568416-Alexandrium_andersonii.AAC.1
MHAHSACTHLASPRPSPRFVPEGMDSRLVAWSSRSNANRLGRSNLHLCSLTMTATTSRSRSRRNPLSHHEDS